MLGVTLQNFQNLQLVSTVDVTSATSNTDVFFTLRVTDASGIDEPIDQWGYPAISSSWLHKSDSPPIRVRRTRISGDVYDGIFEAKLRYHQECYSR